MTVLSPSDWDDFIQAHPTAHLLQTSTWGALKSYFGWHPIHLQENSIGALVLFRALPLGYSIAYIPRGPVGEGDWSVLWPAVDTLCQQQRSIFLRVEPEIWLPTEDDFAKRNLPGFDQSQQTVQPPRTVRININSSEEDLLAGMKPKTRYNIRLAERKEITVHPSDDIALFHRMLLTTGDRDAFGIHSLAYYQRAHALFAANDACTLLIASYKGRPLAGLMAFAQGETAWYLYGASTNEERNRMPTYLLQWEAMRWARSKGCKVYDLWGIPDEPEEVLENRFLDRSDGLWGVYRFKRGFGGRVERTIGAWDKVYKPTLYKLYQRYARRKQISGT